jgi:hypothetical protein
MTSPKLDASDPRTWSAILDEPGAADTPAADSGEQPPDDPIAALSKHWCKEHERDVRRRQKQLLKDAPGARASESAVLSAAARDLSLAEELWRAQAQLASRIGALIDQPKTVLMLARALREVTGCRNAATSRAEGLLLAAGTLRAQQRLANTEGKSGLRRVA